MRRKRIIEGEQKFPSAILFMLGFLGGMMIPNLLWKKTWGYHTLSSVYLMNTVWQAEYIDSSFLFEIWKEKGCYLFLTILSGFTIFGVPLTILEMLLLGFFTSSVLTVSILQFGLYGGIVGITLLMPQFLFYYPACFILLEVVYREAWCIWKRRGALPEKMTGYGRCVLASVSLTVAGSILEAFVNPRLLRLVLRVFQIFE